MSSTPFTNPLDSAGFTSSHVSIPAPTNDPDVSVSIFYRHFKPPASSSTARPLLLLHGYPQTHAIWSDVAPVLAASGKWEIVIPDNRGVGKSSAPPPRSDGVNYSRYSKREMARDMVELMRSLGHGKFWVVAHDRGARVAHRLALDWPEKLNKLIMLDIAPTLDMYQTTDYRFATYYYHWFFLLQPTIAETFISSNPRAYLSSGIRYATQPPCSTTVSDWRTSEYLANLSQPASVLAMCEDYRASAPLNAPDLELDRQDRKSGRKIRCEVAVLWGKKGVIEMMYAGAVDMWKECVEGGKVEGRGVECGHFVPEEAPEAVLEEVERFFG
ncbi:Epoxide hydrolase [Pseudozyma hubeiensis]|nr:Epoxide hydrolase [Pseudozyma hubeiensis]